MKTIKNIPISNLTANDAEQAYMIISGVNERADYSDRIPFTSIRTFITSQLNARVDQLEQLINNVSGGLGGLGVPFGVISMWYGAEGSVPSGWAICNGQSVARSDGQGQIQTPDLRNRVVIGAGSVLGQGATGGALDTAVTTNAAGGHTHNVGGGGGHFHSISVEGTAITIDQMPAHRHGNGVLDDGTKMFNHGYFSAATTTPDSIDNDGSSGRNEGWTTTEGGNQPHSHNANITGNGEHTHTADAAGEHTHSFNASTLQPSMGLHYIMKV